MTLIRGHLGSPAMIVACVSLVVALGGISYAAGCQGRSKCGPWAPGEKWATC
jgi:hypothetical protein